MQLIVERVVRGRGRAQRACKLMQSRPPSDVQAEQTDHLTGPGGDAVKKAARSLCLTSNRALAPADRSRAFLRTTLKRIGYDQQSGNRCPPALTFQESDNRTIAFGELC